MAKLFYICQMDDDMNFQEIGQTVRNARKSQNLTQAEAADLCDVSLRAFSGVENGDGQNSITALDKISNGLDVPFDLSFPLDEE